MKKRFTDVEKWSDLWFRKLPVAYKVFWGFLCDNVDNAGVWKIDEEAASFYIGDKIHAAEALRLFNEGKSRVASVDAERWLLLGFVAFQYGTLSVDCNAHKGVFKDLERNGLHLSKDGQIQLPEGASEPCYEPEPAQGGKPAAPAEKEPQRPPRRPQQAEKAAKAGSPALPEWLDPQTWAEFKELRLKLRRPLTAKGEGLIISKLDTLRAQGNDPKAVLLQTIENSWQGVFQLRDKNTSAGAAAPKAGKYAEVRRISTESEGAK
jgi:hypothetical protein